MPYCSKCGNKVSDQAKYCDSCGESVGSVKQVPTQTELSPDDMADYSRWRQLIQASEAKQPSTISPADMADYRAWRHSIENAKTQNKSRGLVCPHCGSENVLNYSLWKKSSNTMGGLGAGIGTGLGCLSGSFGCMTLVLLLIFAPLLLILVGVGIAVILPIMVVLGVVALVVYLIQSGVDSGRYICLKCKTVFKP